MFAFHRLDTFKLANLTHNASQRNTFTTELAAPCLAGQTTSQTLVLPRSPIPLNKEYTLNYRGLNTMI